MMIYSDSGQWIRVSSETSSAWYGYTLVGRTNTRRELYVPEVSSLRISTIFVLTVEASRRQPPATRWEVQG